MYASCPGGVAFGGVIRALQSNLNLCYSPGLQLPTFNWRSAGQLAGPVHENGQPLTTQSVQHHSLSGTISFRLLACYSLLPARPGYMSCWVESLCMKCFWVGGGENMWSMYRRKVALIRWLNNVWKLTRDLYMGLHCWIWMCWTPLSQFVPKRQTGREVIGRLGVQQNSYLCIPFLGIARPQSQFPHSCVCERFIYSQDWSTYFPAAE